MVCTVGEDSFQATFAISSTCYVPCSLTQIYAFPSCLKPSVIWPDLCHFSDTILHVLCLSHTHTTTHPLTHAHTTNTHPWAHILNNSGTAWTTDYSCTHLLWEWSAFLGFGAKFLSLLKARIWLEWSVSSRSWSYADLLTERASPLVLRLLLAVPSSAHCGTIVTPEKNSISQNNLSAELWLHLANGSGGCGTHGRWEQGKFRAPLPTICFRWQVQKRLQFLKDPSTHWVVLAPGFLPALQAVAAPCCC